MSDQILSITGPAPIDTHLHITHTYTNVRTLPASKSPYTDSACASRLLLVSLPPVMPSWWWWWLVVAEEAGASCASSSLLSCGVLCVGRETRRSALIALMRWTDPYPPSKPTQNHPKTHRHAAITAGKSQYWSSRFQLPQSWTGSKTGFLVVWNDAVEGWLEGYCARWAGPSWEGLPSCGAAAVGSLEKELFFWLFVCIWLGC